MSWSYNLKSTLVPEIVLASSSPYRARLLARLGIAFTQTAPGISEIERHGETPPERALRLAIAKARALAGPERLVIGSDQVAERAGSILHKPGTTAAAEAQLAACAGKSVSFHTGVALLDTNSQRTLTHVERFTVHFRALSDAEIRRYVAIDQPLDCAGAFKWEALGICLFARLEGDDPTSLEGLPLIALTRMLNSLGIAVPPEPGQR